MKFFFDLLPVILFFVSFRVAEGHPQAAAALVSTILGAIGAGAAVSAQQAPILLSTLVVMFLTVLQIGWVRLRNGKVDKMLWISLVLVVFFGGLTLIFRNENFIKWKPTVLYWLFAAGLLFSSAVLKKNLIRGMMEAQMKLPDLLWASLNRVWAVFFAVLGVLNLLVAFNFSTSAWVSYKLFGSTALMLAFMLVQMTFLSKHIEKKQG